MATEFDDTAHYALFKGQGAIRTGNSFEVRWSEITLAALRSAGFLDNMVDGLTPPAIDKLWLDKNTDPATLKEWDPVGANWQQVSNQTLFGRVPWRGSWASSPVYRRADIVSYQGNIWIAVQPSQNKTPIEGAYWNLFIPALADNSVTTAKLVDKSVTPSKLDAGIMAFGTRSAAAAASINASIHSITINLTILQCAAATELASHERLVHLRAKAYAVYSCQHEILTFTAFSEQKPSASRWYSK